MNTSLPQTQPPDSAEPEASVPRLFAAPRRLNGKIASLPKEQRDLINRLLLDGATYEAIVQQMAEHSISLNIQNIANWYQTGFQDYLAQLERLDFQRARYEAATDLLQETDTSRLPQAALQTAAAQIYDLLGHFTPAALVQNIADDPDKYTRIVNALSRLARETLALQKYHDVCAQARAALRELKDPKRKLTESETRAIVEQVDQILGLTSEPEPRPAPHSPTADQPRVP